MIAAVDMEIAFEPSRQREIADLSKTDKELRVCILYQSGANFSTACPAIYCETIAQQAYLRFGQTSHFRQWSQVAIPVTLDHQADLQSWLLVFVISDAKAIIDSGKRSRGGQAMAVARILPPRLSQKPIDIAQRNGDPPFNHVLQNRRIAGL